MRIFSSCFQVWFFNKCTVASIEYILIELFYSGFTSIATYFLTKELWSEGAGLFAACFIAIVPGYISRSVAGSYDNEGIAIFALQFTYYLWVWITIIVRLLRFVLIIYFSG